MKKPQKDSKEYISELEDKIIDLSLQLKTQNNLLELIEIKNNKLISKLTHNLKNPIGTAFSFSEMMLVDSDKYTPEKLEKHLQIVKDSSQYAISLLNKFANFQRISTLNCNYNFELINYIELLTKIIENFNKQAESNCSILINTIPKEIFELNIDAEKIALVLKQIIENAMRFSSEYSIIIVDVKNNNNYIETTITDTGIGISENDLKDVFNDFFVVNTYDSYKKKCIGLGLSMAQKIIQKHKGIISINSILGKGTTVKISLPIHK